MDRWLWQYLKTQTFTRKDFYELERGIVRLSPELREHLSRNGFTLSKNVGQWVEEVAKRLGDLPSVRNASRQSSRRTTGVTGGLPIGIAIGDHYLWPSRPRLDAIGAGLS